MSRNLFANMLWLPQPPEDFSAQCRRMPAAGDTGRQLQYLASHALNENQLNRLAGALARTRVAGLSLAPLQPFRLGVIGNATSHFLKPALEAVAARYGFALECIEAGYGQFMQEALSPDSVINRAGVDAVLLAIDHRGLPLQPVPGDAAAARQSVDAALAQLAMVRDGLRRHGGGPDLAATCGIVVRQQRHSGARQHA